MKKNALAAVVFCDSENKLSANESYKSNEKETYIS